MRAAGVSTGRPVVVYDAAWSLAAARAWWLLRHHGHPDVRVLDGGLAAWLAAGGECATGQATIAPGDFEAGLTAAMPVLDADAAGELARRGTLLDARTPERFRGEVEPIDPAAGHIPGARNLPMARLLHDDGRFRDPAALAAELDAVGALPGSRIGAYCGSGITAAHTVLALEVADRSGALYPGSWSEWSGLGRAVARGAG